MNLKEAIPTLNIELRLNRTANGWDLNEEATKAVKDSLTQAMQDANMIADSCLNCGLICSQSLMQNGCPNCGGLDLTSKNGDIK